MIILHRLNNEEFVLNADYIETLEATPDTVVTLTSGKKLMVKNPVDDIVRQVITYKQRCHQTLQVIQKEKEA